MSTEVEEGMNSGSQRVTGIFEFLKAIERSVISVPQQTLDVVARFWEQHHQIVRPSEAIKRQETLVCCGLESLSNLSMMHYYIIDIVNDAN